MSSPRSKSILLLCVGLGAVTLAWQANTADGQIFGPRTLGRPLSAQQRPGMISNEEATSSAGALTGDERFIRGNRDATDFVGVDRAEANSFVGAGQVIQGGRVRSAIESLQDPPDRSGQLNRLWQAAAANSPYPPKIELDFPVSQPTRFWSDERPPIGHFELEVTGELKRVIPGQSADDQQDGLNLPDRELPPVEGPSQLVFDQANPDLTRRVRKSGAQSLEVFVAGRTAVIRGAASSPKQRQLAELLLGFEPGISTVRNEIVVVNP